MKNGFLMIIIGLQAMSVIAQPYPDRAKERLDFAKMYVEIGGSALSGRSNGPLSTGLVQSTLHWGGFHFWGHADFYVSIPLWNAQIVSDEEPAHTFSHSVVTGARFFPWPVQAKGFRPYVGISWSGLTYQQHGIEDEEAPEFQKNFAWVTDVGAVYTFGNLAARFGVNYFPDRSWQYPTSKSFFDTVKTPPLSVQFGLLYTMEQTRTKNEAVNRQWNSYPAVSSPGRDVATRGDFFIGAGPSSSFSLMASAYTSVAFPYLNRKPSSDPYLDFSLGYHHYGSQTLSVLSFRSPTFKNSGYDTSQRIHKKSFALEVTRFLVDYSGFTPFVGFNVAYDRIEYRERVDEMERVKNFAQLTPGVTFGWDILPGKTHEYLILRTNLRWYPFASFEIDGHSFSMRQLEYDLIQAVFYPGRLLRKRG